MSVMEWIRDKGMKMQAGRDRANERLRYGMDDETLLQNCRGGYGSFERAGEVSTYRREAINRGLLRDPYEDED